MLERMVVDEDVEDVQIGDVRNIVSEFYEEEDFIE